MPTRVSALEPKVFTKAAKVLPIKLVCCNAIYDVTEVDHSEAEKYFTTLMKPYKQSFKRAWYGDFSQENQLAHQLGLLLCAEVLKDETKAKGKRK